ncbi:hypothetical protein Dimus_034320 [Dionaea muscipula]
MKSFRDWGFTQLFTNSLVLSRPLSGGSSLFNEATQDEEPPNSGSRSIHSAMVVSSQIPPGADNQEDSPPPCQPQVSSDNSSNFHDHIKSKKLDSFSRIEALEVKLFRVLHRLQQSSEDPIVAKVLYRIHLATLIQAGDSDLKRINLNSDKARAVAAVEDSVGQPELQFPLKVLVLGKTGVGKSATINSIFDQTKAATDAFRPGTDHIQEVVGTVNGIKITFIDTPGFIPNSANSMRRNRKIMHSIKRYIRKRPPDIILYFERLDLINLGYSDDYPLLKLITEVFGSAIWFNTIIIMTHAASAAPEGPGGFPLNFESYATQCTDLLQHYIHQSVSDTKLENPVVLVENHPLCRRNIMGEKILPNGQAWKSHFLLLCVCTKVLGDANSFLRLDRRSIELGPSGTIRFPSVPHLLSSFLKKRSVVSASGANDEVEEYLLWDTEDDDDEYDQLPPICPLTKTQFEKLSDYHKKEYLDEMYYRETLFLKKQLKEEESRRREESVANDGNSAESNSPSDAFPLPEMPVPPSFDPDSVMHRYRGLVTSDRWLWRPVLDPHGWDHDVGFDGVNLDTTMEVKKNVIASVSGQMSKDKQDFNIQSECSAAFVAPGLCTYVVGLDVQSTGKDLICTLHSDAKLRFIMKYNNIPGCGVSVISFRNKNCVGAKLEDAVYVGKRLKFVVNAGRMGGFDEAAYGGSFEATLKGRDYPVRNDKVSMALTFLSFNDDTVLGGGFESDFRLQRGMRLSVNANLNSRRMGKLCIKASSSEHIKELASLGLFSIFSMMMIRRRRRREQQRVV